ncbi:MAG: hypothetical protein M0Q54_02850 [Pigmentiphaga sp.]|nr:hypothetical protein [Pigmentiphaga sp.]
MQRRIPSLVLLFGLSAAAVSVHAVPANLETLESLGVQVAQLDAILRFCHRDRAAVTSAYQALVNTAQVSASQQATLSAAYEKAQQLETARVTGNAKQRGQAAGACSTEQLQLLDAQVPTVIQALHEIRAAWPGNAVTESVPASASPAVPVATPKTPPSVSPAAEQAMRPGKYSCYTFDAGQLNYAYTDVQIEEGGRYRVGKQTGAYRLSQGQVTFTGHLSNAVGRYAVKQTGVPQLDLVFNGDPRASMTCPRAR